MNLLEPLGMLSGQAASDAMQAGLALPLAGGPDAFTLARLHGSGPPRLVSVSAIPEEFALPLSRLTRQPAPWAGLPTDRPIVVGILNTTPDSFSDGGDNLDPDRAIATGLAMDADGADVIDVGGESTRPGAAPADAAVEQARVLPVIRALAGAGIVVSVDTRQASTMAAALAAGARIVNDVSGLSFDPAAADLVRASGCPAVVMHMRGVPRTMQSLTDYDDVALDVTRELAATLARLGLPAGRVAVDPGLGFAKGPGHSEALLDRLPLLLNLGCRIVVGASRKGFVGRNVLAGYPKDRMAGSLAAALAALCGGATILRVHDVSETVQCVRMWQAIRRVG